MPVAKPTFQMLKKGFWAEYTGLGMLHKGKNLELERPYQQLNSGVVKEL